MEYREQNWLSAREAYKQKISLQFTRISSFKTFVMTETCKINQTCNTFAALCSVSRDQSSHVKRCF